jgi:hypothetical protein
MAFSRRARSSGYTQRSSRQTERHLFDPENTIFELTLDVSEGRPMFRWRPSPEAPEELLMPSLAWFSIFQQLLPGKYSERYVAVHSRYSLEPDGPDTRRSRRGARALVVP